MNREEYAALCDEYAYSDNGCRDHFKYLLGIAIIARFRLLKLQIKEILDNEDLSDHHSIDEMKKRLSQCSKHLDLFKHRFDQIEKL